MMYLDSISLTKTTPCLAEPGKIIVTGRPSRRLDEVIPYLASLPSVISYNPGAGAVTFRRHPGFLTVYPERVFITQVKDVQEALELLAALVGAINATWEGRGKLVAAAGSRRSPSFGYMDSPASIQLQGMWREDLHGFCLQFASPGQRIGRM